MPGLVVYTAIFGNIKDDLPNSTLLLPEGEDEQIRYVVYTDRPGKTCWEKLPAHESHPNDPRRTARFHKTCPHWCMMGHPLCGFPIDYSLWMDGNFILRTSPFELVKRYLQDADIATFTHRDRKCIYEEFEACRRLKKDDPLTMAAQRARYESEGYPKNRGLSETGCVLRRHTPRMCLFNMDWYKEIAKGSCRDQLSFDYVAWKHGLKVNRFNGAVGRCPHFHFRPHR